VGDPNLKSKEPRRALGTALDGNPPIIIEARPGFNPGPLTHGARRGITIAGGNVGYISRTKAPVVVDLEQSARYSYHSDSALRNSRSPRHWVCNSVRVHVDHDGG